MPRALAAALAVIVGVVVAVLIYLTWGRSAPEPTPEGGDVAAEQVETGPPEGGATPPAAETAVTAPRSGTPPATGRATARPGRGAATTPAVAPPTTSPPPAAAATAATGAPRPVIEKPARPVPAAEAPRGDGASWFLPGSSANWVTVGDGQTPPLVVRASGLVTVDRDIAGPGGIAPPPRAGGAPGALALRAAPYLALLGRVCSTRACSDPFVVGTGRAVCAAGLPPGGTLQVWTNNFVEVGDRQTRSSYSGATGGFALYVEPAPSSVCTDDGREAGVTPAQDDAARLAAGEPLRRADFVLSSGQAFWKPFFLPLSSPLRITATGNIRGETPRPTTGPDGVVLEGTARFWTRVRQDGTTYRLYYDGLPFQALVGRLCGGGSCGEAFVVGSSHVLCGQPPGIDRVELWINHVVRAPRLLDTQTPVTWEMFDVQARSGEYRFEVQRAPTGACQSVPQSR